MQKIGYLGPEGSYSFIAVKKMCPDAEHIAYSSFALVVSSLISGQTDGVVVPIENSLNGGVMQNIDLLQYTEGICAVEEYTVKIDHRLVTKEGADLNNIKRIFSHSQALEQCSAYLKKHFPSAQLCSAPSTAGSLDMISEITDAGIAGAHLKREGLVFSENNIADDENNYTHFLLVRRGSVPENARTSKIYFSFTCLNKAGELVRVLERVFKNGFNMTKLQSRPIKNTPEAYRFFIETEGDYSSDKVKFALADIRANCAEFKLLGCY